MLKPTIGIEVHIELKSNTKVFSKSKNAYSNMPNEYVNEIDMGLPGTLPLLNKYVIDSALKAALALNCKINKEMHFDRKNYFYPDLPKGYQITQNDTPIGYDGHLTINVDGNLKDVEIERIHIEEDTCKSIHSIDGTLLNFNRAGVPLIEIVTKPVIESAKEAVAYLESLRLTLLYLGISDVKIEEGSMRCDANVSLREETSETLGTKTEIKNIGSITNVGISIDYEIKRQTEMLNKGLKIATETRRFDDKTLTTVLMRLKETGNDYRYFPEPDIPTITLTDEYIKTVKDALPLNPSDLKNKYITLGINDNNIKTLINNYDLCNYFESILSKVNPVIASNILTGDILSYLNKNKLNVSDTKINNNFVLLVNALETNKISSKQAKQLIEDVLLKDIITDLIENNSQISDDTKVLEIIKKIISENSESVDDYKQGKDRAIKFLMGQIMKETKGQINPMLANNVLISELNKL